MTGTTFFITCFCEKNQLGSGSDTGKNTGGIAKTVHSNMVHRQFAWQKNYEMLVFINETLKLIKKTFTSCRTKKLCAKHERSITKYLYEHLPSNMEHSSSWPHQEWCSEVYMPKALVPSYCIELTKCLISSECCNTFLLLILYQDWNILCLRLNEKYCIFRK